MKKKIGIDKILFNTISYCLIGFYSILCLIPFVMVVSSSFTSQNYIYNHGYSLIPMEFSLEGYTAAFKNPITILRAYGVTLFVTCIGTFFGVVLMAMTGYVLQRKDFKWRNIFSFYIFFTSLFSGGLVPWYILCVKYLNMNNKISSLIIPYLFSVFYIILFKSFMRGIPDALTESAKIDGANDFTIFLRIILPVAKPAVATVALFVALGYWNDWYLSMIFIKNEKLWSLQYFLYSIVSNAEAMRNFVMSRGNATSVNYVLPTESLKMAMTVIVTGPILILYPFVQKYFVKGITVGSVKG